MRQEKIGVNILTTVIVIARLITNIVAHAELAMDVAMKIMKIAPAIAMDAADILVVIMEKYVPNALDIMIKMLEILLTIIGAHNLIL